MIIFKNRVAMMMRLDNQCQVCSVEGLSLLLTWLPCTVKNPNPNPKTKTKIKIKTKNKTKSKTKTKNQNKKKKLNKTKTKHFKYGSNHWRYWCLYKISYGSQIIKNILESNLYCQNFAIIFKANMNWNKVGLLLRNCSNYWHKKILSLLR